MKKKKKKDNNGLYSFIGLFLLIGIMIVVMISLKVFDTSEKSKKEQFKMESRVEKVLDTEVSEKSSFKTIGWLRIEGTNIDYPIVQSEERASDFPVELESYAWSLNFDDKFHNMINIMGHNIYNLSSTPKLHSSKFKRLEELMSFVYYDFAKDNRYMQLTIDGKDYIYKIFSVNFIASADTNSFPVVDDYSKEELKTQIDYYKKDSLYKYDVDVNEDDSLISVVTCTRFFGNEQNYDFFVNGRLLRDGEEIDNYKVTTTKNYKNIEKKLKGDGNHEDDSL